MTRRLLLLRHGKSDYPPGVDDRDRPLAKRGRKDSTRVGAAVAARRLHPDYVVVSPALRTRETWSAFREGLAGGPREESKREPPESFAPPIESTDERIYANTIGDLIDVVRETPGDIHTLLLVGHNPSTPGLAGVLDPDAPPAEAERLRPGYPTATLTVFEVSDAWADIQPGAGRLRDVILAKDLR